MSFENGGHNNNVINGITGYEAGEAGVLPSDSQFTAQDKLNRHRNAQYIKEFEERYRPGESTAQRPHTAWRLFAILSLALVAVIAYFCLQQVDAVLGRSYPDQATQLSLYAQGIGLPDARTPGAAAPTPTDDMCRELAHKYYGYLADFPVKADWTVSLVKVKGGQSIPVCRVANDAAYTESIPKKKLYGSLLVAALGIAAAALSTLVLKRMFYRKG